MATSIFGGIVGARRLEAMLCRLCRRPVLRKNLRLGSLAYAYAANLEGAPTRLARLENYQLSVHLKAPWGIRSYFFGECGAFPVLDALLEPGSTFIDAGANIGQFSARATSVLNGNGLVFAFEPDPVNRTLLEQTVADNGWENRLQVSGQALWKLSGDRLKFYPSQSVENTGTSSLVQHGVHQDTDEFIEVGTLTLDDFLEKETIQNLRLIKIDVERAEYELLQGFQAGLARQAADFILIEMEGHGPCLELLKESGYQGFQLAGDHSLRPMDAEGDQDVHDFLFAAPGQVDTVRNLRAFKP